MNKSRFLSLLCALALTSSVVRAGHGDPEGSTGLLEYEAEQLEQIVNSSYLNYNVKRSVIDFAGSVHRLIECVNYGTRRIFHDHSDEVGCPSQCTGELQYAQSAFAQVSRYLRDTQWDFPQVYNQWRRTHQVLRAISVSGPGPGPAPTNYRCTAVDRGWEEHGGHQGFGRSLYEAQRAALGECQRYHGRCVIRSCN